MTRRLIVVLAAVLTVIAAVAVVLVVRESGSSSTPAPAGPDPSAPGSPGSSSVESAATHVHLGDSFAAGTGVTPLAADSPLACQRSSRNFGQLLAERFEWTVRDVSCAGATTSNLTEGQYEGVGPQLDALSPTTETVTVTLGGNDDDVFSTAVGECTRLGRADPRGAPCRAALRTRMVRAIDRVTRPALERGLREIADRAPKARVFVVGYPWLLPASGGCYEQIPIAAGDLPFLHDLQQRLNAAARTAARESGAIYVDMSRLSVGHDACAGPGRWIEPVGHGVASMHPNARGQQAMADAVGVAYSR